MMDRSGIKAEILVDEAEARRSSLLRKPLGVSSSP